MRRRIRITNHDIMADRNTTTIAVRCQNCQRPFETATTAVLTCQDCPRMSSSQASRPSSNSRRTTQSAEDRSIPSSYLQLLDSRIADLEHAAEALRSKPDGTDRVARPGSSKQVGVTPYLTDAIHSRSQRTSPRQSQASSLVMERFLNDAHEPDGV